MIKFTKPLELNGEQLINELNAANIKTTQIPFLDDNNNLWLDIDEKDKLKAETVVNAHIGIDQAEAKETAKAVLLAKLGITAEEAKLLLS